MTEYEESTAISIATAADIAGVSSAEIDAQIRSGALVAVQDGRSVSMSTLISWLNRREPDEKRPPRTSGQPERRIR